MTDKKKTELEKTLGNAERNRFLNEASGIGARQAQAREKVIEAIGLLDDPGNVNEVKGLLDEVRDLLSA